MGVALCPLTHKALSLGLAHSGRSLGMVMGWQLMWHEKNHDLKVKVSFKVMGAGLLWAQMLSLLFFSCADPRKGSDPLGSSDSSFVTGNNVPVSLHL